MRLKLHLAGMGSLQKMVEESQDLMHNYWSIANLETHFP